MIITATSTKGGVGKTTSLVAIAGEFADRGQKTLILDLDPNKPIEKWGRKKQKCEDVTVQTVDMERFVPVFKDHAASGEYEHILIDLPGFGLSGAYRAIGRSDFVIVPCGPSQLDMNEAVKTCRDVNDIGETANRVIPVRALMTRVPSTNNRVTQYIREQLKLYGLRAFETEMVERIAYKDMFITGQPLTGLDKKATGEVSGIVHEIRLAVQEANHKQKGAA